MKKNNNRLNNTQEISLTKDCIYSSNNRKTKCSFFDIFLSMHVIVDANVEDISSEHCIIYKTLRDIWGEREWGESETEKTRGREKDRGIARERIKNR